MSTVWELALLFVEGSAYTVLFLYAGVIAHEAGHALAAVAVGAQVRGVSVYGGRAVLEGTARGIPYRFGWIPYEGHIAVRMDTRLRWFRVRVAVLVVAGPAVNVAVGLCALLLSPRSLWGLSLVSSSITLLLCALAPSHGASDGDVLWALLRGRDVPSEPAAVQGGQL